MKFGISKGVIFFIVVFAVGTVWLRLTIVKTTYEINEVTSKTTTLKQEVEKTELKVTSLKSPRRLEVLARTRFGLTPPKTDQVLHVK